MNYRGSYRALLGNAFAAMTAAIEFYNKPQVTYRDETVAILVVNAWELLLKAILSKAGQSIYYRKRRREPYRTLSLVDSLRRAKPYFPGTAPFDPVVKNIDMLVLYRDNAVHFYNNRDFSKVMYTLFQTSIVNFRDVANEVFGRDLKDDVNIAILPLAFGEPPDQIQLLTRGARGQPLSQAVGQFIMEMRGALQYLESIGADTQRFLTLYNVRLESTKKITSADLVVGLRGGTATEAGPLLVFRRFDPNDPNWVRCKDIVADIGTLHGRQMTSYVFQACIRFLNISGNPAYCWRAMEGVLTKYSKEVVALILRMSRADLDRALTDYRSFLQGRRRQPSS